MDIKKTIILLAHSFIGWALCGATMGIGMALTTIDNSLITHLIAAPIFFGIISFLYFTKFNYTTPLVTASIFVGFVIIVDFLLVALIINKSLEMFESLMGTWIPFVLIFVSTYLTGTMLNKSKPANIK